MSRSEYKYERKDKISKERNNEKTENRLKSFAIIIIVFIFAIYNRYNGQRFFL